MGWCSHAFKATDQLNLWNTAAAAAVLVFPKWLGLSPAVRAWGRVGSSQVDSTCSQQCCAGVACHSQRQWLRLPYDLVTPAPGNPPAQGLILALGHSCIWPPTMMGAPLDLICRRLCICQSLWVDQSCAHSFC